MAARREQSRVRGGAGEPGQSSLGYIFAGHEDKESPPAVQSESVAKVTATSAELRLNEGEKVNVTAKGGTLAVTATVAGVKGTLSCETELSGASLENPSGGGNGTGSAELKYKGCKTEPKWEGCKVTPGAAVSVKLALTTLEGKAQALLSPKEGTVLGTYTFAECTNSEFNGKWELTGVARGLYSNAASQIEFNAETTATELKISGIKATAVGTIGLEASGGGYVRAE